MTVLGCIADDFTGATDLAGLLARSGVRVRLHTGLPEALPQGETVAFEVIALKIRTAPVDEAVAQARVALDWLRKAGAERFFWKYCSTFDSTSEGNIGPVAEALMADLGAGATIHCPAFPENGRRVFMGNLFVHRQPISESPMKDHPLTPVRDSDVTRLLSRQVRGAVALADHGEVAAGATWLRQRINTLSAAGAAHIVVDAINDDDLSNIAKACRDMPLICGGSAVAMTLPQLYVSDGTLSADALHAAHPSLAPGAIVLSGSASAATNAQVSRYLARGVPSLRLDPLDLAANGHGAALDWIDEQDLSCGPLIYATAQPESVRIAQEKLGAARAGALVEAALAALAVRARDLGAQRIVVAGGETSGAVTQALGVKQMDIGPEIAPGVPWCFCVSAGQQIALTLKSGNFGAETFFSDALEQLGAS
ncbi:MAG: four-carbon acid sugar kinase family protein [Halomonas sp.]|nr:3-oxo-tetronate kinase [Halomonas sp.]MBP5979875.1 four-carbon acid sugar kinase family protein [Halomonas sp.]